MKIYHLYIYLCGEDFNEYLVHESELCAQNNHDALDTTLFLLEHHAKCDKMEFTSCRLFHTTNAHDNYLGEEIAIICIGSDDLCA